MASSNQEKHGRQQTWEPLWMHAFMANTFFGICNHHAAHKNEQLKRYCIDCRIPACIQCIEGNTHEGHRVLKIIRYSQKDAVLKKEITQHLDCSEIQAYICNKEHVIALNPVPHRGSQKSGEQACVTCSRRLMDPVTNRYCSLACKREFMSKEKNAKRSRKGTPHRAPTT